MFVGQGLQSAALYARSGGPLSEHRSGMPGRALVFALMGEGASIKLVNDDPKRAVWAKLTHNERHLVAGVTSPRGDDLRDAGYLLGPRSQVFVSDWIFACCGNAQSLRLGMEPSSHFGSTPQRVITERDTSVFRVEFHHVSEPPPSPMELDDIYQMLRQVLGDAEPVYGLLPGSLEPGEVTAMPVVGLEVEPVPFATIELEYGGSSALLFRDVMPSEVKEAGLSYPAVTAGRRPYSAGRGLARIREERVPQVPEGGMFRSRISESILPPPRRTGYTNRY